MSEQIILMNYPDYARYLVREKGYSREAAETECDRLKKEELAEKRRNPPKLYFDKTTSELPFQDGEAQR